MKTIKRTLCVLLTLVLLTSMAAVLTMTAHADEKKQITVNVGAAVKWRDYFTVPAGYTVRNPYVRDEDGCANMSGENIIRCKKAGRATFTAALTGPDGSGYVCTLEITITDPNGYLAILHTQYGTFEDGKTTICNTYSQETIELSQLPQITGSGYVFVGWTDGTTTWTNSDPVTLLRGQAKALEAKWRPYLITLDPTGGTCEQTALEAVKERPLGSLPTPTRSGFVFDGWYTGKYDGALWTATTVFDGADNVTLYAHWTSQALAIKTISVSGVTAPKVGKTITTSGVKISEGVNVTDISWGKKQPGGAYTHTSETSFAAGGEYDLFIRLQTKSGSSFADVVKAYVNGYPADLRHPTTSTYTLTCYFPALPNDVSVTFDPGEGTLLSGNTKTVLSDGTYGEMPIPVRDGYQFDDWYYMTTDGDKRVTADTPVQNTAGHALQAHWTQLKTPVPQIYAFDVSDLKLNYKQTGKLPLSVDADDGAVYTVTYSDYDAGKISVSETGDVTAKGVGETTVTVTAKDTSNNVLTGTCTVTVRYAWWQYLIRIFLLGFLWY